MGFFCREWPEYSLVWFKGKKLFLYLANLGMVTQRW